MMTNGERTVGSTQANRDVQRRRGSWPGGGIAAAIVICVAGCGAENEADVLVGTQSRLMTDDSGLVTVAITQCAPVSFPGGFGSTSCPVAPGFVLVGGGARVVGEPEPGALLQASRPNGQSWFAQAKDHVHPCAFQLQAASIGLKLQGISQSALQAMVTVTVKNSGTPSHHPSVLLDPPVLDNRVVTTLGGGASVHDLGGQQLLTQSVLNNGNGSIQSWTAASKDHEIAYLDTVDGYIITMPTCPVGLAHGACLSTFSELASSSPFRGGYNPVTLTTNHTDTGLAPFVGVGGQAAYNVGGSAGRLLTAIWPTDVGDGINNTLLVDSKDHDLPEQQASIAISQELFVGL